MLIRCRAAKAAMAVLRGGGSAVDGVEIAVKVLEDREITNAGYGSNLTVDGVAECDAIVVDHYGRSGAAGAVAREYTLARRGTIDEVHALTLAQRSKTLFHWRGSSSATRLIPCHSVEFPLTFSSVKAPPTLRTSTVCRFCPTTP